MKPRMPQAGTGLKMAWLIPTHVCRRRYYWPAREHRMMSGSRPDWSHWHGLGNNSVVPCTATLYLSGLKASMREEAKKRDLISSLWRQARLSQRVCKRIVQPVKRVGAGRPGLRSIGFWEITT